MRPRNLHHHKYYTYRIPKIQNYSEREPVHQWLRRISHFQVVRISQILQKSIGKAEDMMGSKEEQEDKKKNRSRREEEESVK